MKIKTTGCEPVLVVGGKLLGGENKFFKKSHHVSDFFLCFRNFLDRDWAIGHVSPGIHVEFLMKIFCIGGFPQNHSLSAVSSSQQHFFWS